MPRTDPGDAVVILNIAAHHEYTLRGIHLFAERSITLNEAICGTALSFTTLDERKLLVSHSSLYSSVSIPYSDHSDPTNS